MRHLSRFFESEKKSFLETFFFHSNRHYEVDLIIDKKRCKMKEFGR